MLHSVSRCTCFMLFGELGGGGSDGDTVRACGEPGAGGCGVLGTPAYNAWDPSLHG
jgi:hypothetical protein